jgi:hypothetical protein
MLATKEQRYQEEKANFLFHDLSCYMRGLDDYGGMDARVLAVFQSVDFTQIPA